MGRVKKVDLYENGTIAIVEAVSPELGNRVQRVRVQLPGTSQVRSGPMAPCHCNCLLGNLLGRDSHTFTGQDLKTSAHMGLPVAVPQELLTKFREKKVDFAAHTQTEDGGAVFFNLLGTLALRHHMGQCEAF